MAFAPPFFFSLILLASLPASAGESARFRQWTAGQEAGGSSHSTSRDAAGDLDENRQWTHMERMGTLIEQELTETARRRPDGSLSFTWVLSLSKEPLQGGASWSPREPGILRMTFKNGPPRTLELPKDVLLWPGDLDDALKNAARKGLPVTVKTFELPTQQWSVTELTPVGPEPLPGFPDTVHFRGRSCEGSLAEDVELWISPVQGEIKELDLTAGIPMVSQRVELPAPVAGPGGQGFFDRTIKALPPHPFLLWLPEVQVRWTGKGVQALPEDPQQRRSADNHYTLTRASAPTGAAAAEMPVKGQPSSQDAPFLAPSPLVQFNDPVFDGLEQRLRAPRGATRWQLAQRVTTFVYDWIVEKNYTVGFASAQEVARTPRGDCTEHGTLAVALLRRLGVPARGVTGWVAFGESMGLHFWVEARIGDRWIPLDPTFDQAPASSYRVKLGTTDLADLGSVGWDSASMTFLEGAWVPEGPWTAPARIQGDTAMAPDGSWFRVAGGHWQYADGRLELLWEEAHAVQAVPRPAPAQLGTAHRLQGAQNGLLAWWSPDSRSLWVELPNGNWLQLGALAEEQAHRLLDVLEVATGSPAKAMAA